MGLALALDLGTTKIAALVVDPRTGRVVGGARRATPTTLDSAPDRSERDPDAIVQAALEAGREAVAAADGAIGVVGITGQMHGVVLTDDDLRPLGPFVDWQDRRGDEVLSGGRTVLDEMAQRVGRAAASGSDGFASGFMGTTLYWLARHDRLQAGARAAFLPDFLVARLCGQPPCTDPTDAAGSGLFDVATGRWSDPVVSALGLPPVVLPEVRPTAALVGTLAAQPAATLGLPAGTPVMNGLGDNQASFMGSVGEPGADLLVNVGTGAQVSVAVARPVRTGRVETRPLLGAGYLAVGSELAGGSAYAALRAFVEAVGRECFGVAEPPDVYAALNGLAARVSPGAGGVVCDPRFAGARHDSGQTGSFRGVTRATFTPGHFARAVLEGTADALAGLYEEMVEAGVRQRTRVVAAGNAVRRNPVLRASLAARFGLPVVVPAHEEEAAFGAALLAAVAVGDLPDLTAALTRIGYQ